MKGNSIIYKYIYIYICICSREVTRNRTTERVETRSKLTTEMDRERTEETINERGKKIIGVS